MTLSLADLAFALDPDQPRPWSLRQSLAVGLQPPVAPTGSLRPLLTRFAQAGAEMRKLRMGGANAWTHIQPGTVITELSARLRDPMVMQQAATGLCGPISIMAAFARREPLRYVRSVIEVLRTGALICPGGRIIKAEAELRHEPLVTQIAQADWLLAATMRDDDNIWEDVDDDANGLESITLWYEQRGWTQDVLGLSAGWKTCFVSGEADCMRKAQDAVAAGGVAYFLIDSRLINGKKTGDEENAWWEFAAHQPRTASHPFGAKRHSADDDFPPDHWVEYLGGLNLGSDPDDDAPIVFRIWCWGGEYRITSDVDAFSEYLYAVVYGH